VERHGQRMREAHFEKLERIYLAAPANEHLDAGVRIAEGSAEIVIPVQDKFLGVAGTLHDSICFTAMADSAQLAVNSVVQKAVVVAVHFEVQLTRPLAAHELIARSRFLGMSTEQYLAESVLMNFEGEEIGTGSGAFVESDLSLSSEGAAQE
jgi:acyl-coenzyme A thioesterase PaaI-like protein